MSFKNFEVFIFIIAYTLSLFPQKMYSQQESKNIFRKVLNYIDKIADNRNVSTDTLYVARPTLPWTVRLRYDMKGNYFETHYNSEAGVKSDFYMENNLNTSFGVSANYRGLSVALSINPQKIAKKTRDTEFNFNYYNNRFGIDLGYADVKHFKASVNYEDLWKSDKYKDNLDGTTLNAVTINAYYVFNGRKFSYPAAFSHAWIQRKSAGSFIVGASFYSGNLHTDINKTPIEVLKKWPSIVEHFTMKNISIGAGYAYNYVPNRHWLIHVSLQPGIMLWKNYNYNLIDTKTFKKSENFEVPRRFFDTSVTARLGATYSWNKYFIGLTSVGFYDHIGNRTENNLGYRWKIRTYLGVRL